MKKSNAWEFLRTIKDPNLMFDLMISAIYFAGVFNTKIPVDEARETFKKIKKLIK